LPQDAPPNPRGGLRGPKRVRATAGGLDYLGLRLTTEARAAVAGVLVALMFLTFVAIRLDPAGGPPGGGLTAVSAKTVPSVWVVHAGDTYGVISARTGVSVIDLENLNPYTYPDQLQVGQRIRLRPPAPAAKPAASSKAAHGK
jgi:LysM domain